MPHRRHPPILMDHRGGSAGPLSGRGFRRHVSAVVFAVAALFAAGAAFDLLLLWGFQRTRDAPTWEFFAIASTIEGLPRIVLGIALSIVGLYLAGSTVLLAYRVLAGMLIAMGVAAIGLTLLAFLDYFALRGSLPASEQRTLISVAGKTIFLGGLEALVLIPAGWRCLRRPS